MIDSDTNALESVTAADFADQTSIELKKGTKLSLFVYNVNDTSVETDAEDMMQILFSLTVLNEKPSMSYLNIATVDKSSGDVLKITLISNIAVGTDIMSNKKLSVTNRARLPGPFLYARLRILIFSPESLYNYGNST